MDNSIPIISGIGYGVIIGALAKIHAQESHHKKSAQEKAETIALAGFNLGLLLCQPLFPERFNPTLTGLAFGLTVGAAKAAFKSKQHSLANITNLVGVFLYHRNEITLPLFLTWATALTAVSCFEQYGAEKASKRTRSRSPMR